MSVSIQTVEFERRDAYLSALEDGPPFTVHGVALGDGDVTVGKSGIKKLWPPSALKESAESLEGRSLVVDHNNGSDGVVGQVTKAGYKENTGVIYEAELFDDDLAEKISNDLLEVSIRGKHSDVEQMEETDEGAKVVEDITFDNLSIVPTGAAPSNTIEMGETDELSMAELSALADSLESAELQEIEPGMWVRSEDVRGVTISAVEDGEVEVDIYEESDGKWRSIGETKMMSVDDLEEWDVDEEEDIGPMEDDEEEDDEEEAEQVDPPEFEEGMMVQWQVNPDMFGKVVHNPDDQNIVMVEVMERMDGEMKPTGHTLTAAPPDLQPMNEDEMTALEELESFSDYPEAAKENAQMALDAREDTDNPNDCGTEVGWRRANQLASGEPVSEAVVAKMSSFNRHRQDSDMDDDEGKTDCGWMMWKAWGGDEGVDWAMNKMDSIEENTEELQDYEMHTPDWSGKTTSDWSSPDMEGFDTDDLEEIMSHFLISATGFPPENFTDLKLPVVEPNGDLNVNALAAVKGGRGVSAVEGLSSDMEDEIVEWVNGVANEEFDKDWGNDEEEAAYGKRERTIDDTGDEKAVKDDGPVDIALDMINKYLTIEGKHERDSVDNMLSWLMGSVDLPIETLRDFRMAARRFLEETPGTDSFSDMTVEQFRDWLLMHGKESQGRREQDERDRMPRGSLSSVNVLTGDDLRQSADKSEESELDDITTKVTNMTEEIEQKLAELSEPVAVEQSDLEELRDKADRFEEMSSTLESLKERTDILDDVDRDQVEELADSEEPVVVESARMESLEGEAEQVKTVYAAALSDEMEAFDAEELADRFSIEELREKYEAQIGDPEEELTGSGDAEPRSGDVEEEELEERAEEEESEEELEDSETDEVEAKREELRNKIIGD